MVDIDRWQQTPGDNDLSPPNGWPEGMARPSVNDTARQDRAAVKAWHDQDEWRNPFLDKNGSEKYTLSRISDTQVDILAVDASASFIVGQRLRIIGATTVEGHVVSATFGSPDTQLVVSIDGAADEPLTPGECTFNAAARTIVTTSAVFANARAGDKLKIEGTTNNDGIAEILTKDSDTQVTIIAGNPYAIEDETATPSALTLIHSGGGVVPTTPTSIELAGVHAASEGAYDSPGTPQASLLRRHDVQPHAFVAERDLVPRGLPPKSWVLGDEEKLVVVERNVLASGTADSGSATTLVDAALSGPGDDYYNGKTVQITGGTGAGQSEVITDFIDLSGTVVVASFVTPPDATSVYRIVDAPVGYKLGSKLPDIQAGDAGKFARVNSAEDGLEYSTSDFEEIHAHNTADQDVTSTPGAEKLVNGCSNLNLPGQPHDGSKPIVVSLELLISSEPAFGGAWGGPREFDIRLRTGTTGTVADGERWRRRVRIRDQDVDSGVGTAFYDTGESHLRELVIFPAVEITPDAGDTKLSLTVDQVTTTDDYRIHGGVAQETRIAARVKGPTP